MTFSNTEATDLENVGEKLKRILFPFYKGFPAEDGIPEFRRRINPEEAEQLFLEIHALITDISERESNNV